MQLYLDGIYRYFVTGHGIGGTNNTSHDKGFLPVKAGSQIIYADAFSDNVVYAGGIDSKLAGTYDTPTSASKNFDTAWNWEKLRKVNYFLNHYNLFQIQHFLNAQILNQFTYQNQQNQLLDQRFPECF